MNPKIVIRYILPLLVLLLAMTSNLRSQTNMVFYQAEDQVVSPGYNPAFLTNQNIFVFSFFPLTGMSVGYNNQKVIKDMILNYAQGKQTNDDFKEVFNSMIKLDLFYQRMEIPLINIGFNTGIGSFNILVKDNMQILTDLKGEFSDFLLNTSEQSVSLNRVQPFPAFALHYREYSLGYAKEIIQNKLAVGLRAKIYFGKFALNSDVKGQVTQKANDFYLQSQDHVNISFPVKIVPDADSVLRAVTTADNFSVGNFLMNSGNKGTGFDLGFTYRINRDFVLSASVIDVGKIYWKNNLNSMKFKGENKFPDEFVKQSDNGLLTKKEGFSAENTDIPELYKIEMDSNPFSTRLPTTFYTGLKYTINPGFKIGFVDRYIYTKEISFNSISITGIYDVSPNLTINSGYSIIGNSYFNMPFALIYKRSSGQYYFGTDNIFSNFSSSAGFAGITFGACFFLFRNKAEKYTEHDYLPFYKEKKH